MYHYVSYKYAHCKQPSQGETAAGADLGDIVANIQMRTLKTEMKKGGPGQISQTELGKPRKILSSERIFRV